MRSKRADDAVEAAEEADEIEAIRRGTYDGAPGDVRPPRCASRSAVKRLTSTPSNSSPQRRRTPQATTICAKPAPCSTQPRLRARRRPVQFPDQELDDRANEFSYGDPEEGKVQLLNTLDAKVRIGWIGHPPERSSGMLSKTNRTMTAAGQSLGLPGRHHRCCDVGVPQTLLLTARGS